MRGSTFLASISRPLVLSVGSELLRVSRRLGVSNSSTFGFRAHGQSCFPRSLGKRGVE